MTLKSNDYYEGVRAAIAALPVKLWHGEHTDTDRNMRRDGWNSCIDAAELEIKALLPKPDPAKVLVERFLKSDYWQGARDSQKLTVGEWMGVFAHWLAEEGIIDPDKVK